MFRRKPKPDLSAAIDAMSSGVDEMAARLAAMAPSKGVTADQIERLIEFLVELLRDDITKRARLSKAQISLAWPLVEAAFRTALRDRLCAKVPVRAVA